MAAPEQSRWRSAALRTRWAGAFVLGEMIGFVPPATVGATLAAIDAPHVALVAGLTLAGMIEGAALGLAQARVLARDAPDIDGCRWIVATVAAAGFACSPGWAVAPSSAGATRPVHF